MGASKALQAGAHLLPQLFFGFTTLIILFNVYIVLQKKDLSATRCWLVEELILNERMEAVSSIDPTTQLFNRGAMEQMMAHEMVRTNRLGTPLSLLILNIAGFEKISKRLGAVETEQFLYATAQLVKNTFRGSDMVFRYTEAQFLVVMPDTNEQQVEFTLKRLESEIARQNSVFPSYAELAFSYGIAQFAQGSRITDTLLTAERKALLHKNQVVTTF